MIVSSGCLLNVRICLYCVAISHLIFAAIYILPIDMSKDEDPRVSVYIRVRWKLLTCWFNLLMLAYFPVCLYCDLKEKRGQGNEKRVKRLRKTRDLIMTSILFPTTMYSDFFFWRLWHKDLELIAPVAIFKYLPFWAQHSLHTVSGIMVLLDVLLVPRRRPTSLLPGVALMSAFCLTYCATMTVSYMNGEVVYSMLDTFSRFHLILLGLLAFIEHLFFFTLQWCVVDLVWGRVKRISTKLD